jgi:EAL domain-containing protein (putative c-di-GMP-specific phosphodiesterase class I)
MSMISEPTVVDGEQVAPSASVGIAISESTPGAGDNAGSLLRDANAAMFKARDRGRSRFEVYGDDMRAAVEARMETESALRRALDHGEIVVHFQPIIELATGRPVGLEALARWAHPTRGLLLPNQFIPLAEETGLIVQLGAQVLEQACLHLADWRKIAPALSNLQMSVNLSPAQLLHPDVVTTVRCALARAGLPPDALCLEITESVLLEDASLAAAALDTLKSLGVQVALDDFGTGYSSLTYLKRLPVDVLKIDRSFVSGLGSSADDAAIVSIVIQLAQAFAMSTVAEGVETASQARDVEALGCARAQGYLWSKPQPAAKTLRYLCRQRPTD